MNRRTPPTRGFTLLSVLMALMIIGILSGMYMSPPGSDGKGGPIYYVSRSKQVACDANRNTLNTRVVAYQIAEGHFPTIAELERTGSGGATCPDGGRYYVVDGVVYCTIHSAVEIPPLD